ncbi:MAG TPA: hypothetical protein VID51_04080 [Solirubrobacterales bacterium]|jgi:hypothetical protein
MVNVIRRWSIPFAVMAVAILALDAVLNLAGAGPSVFFAAITAFAIAGGCYVGRRVVSEDKPQLQNRTDRRTRGASL